MTDDSELDDKIPYAEIIAHLNEVTGKKFKHQSAVTRKYIRARWQEGFTLEDFKYVHQVKAAEWLGSEWDKFLCPTTLYRPSNFEKYLNQREPRKDMSEYGIP